MRVGFFEELEARKPKFVYCSPPKNYVIESKLGTCEGCGCAVYSKRQKGCFVCLVNSVKETCMADEQYDPVEKPKHYNVHPSGIECIQVTEHMNFCLGNAIKYLWRSDHKNGIEDLQKAIWYIQREIQRREKHGPKPTESRSDKG